MFIPTLCLDSVAEIAAAADGRQLGGPDEGVCIADGVAVQGATRSPAIPLLHLAVLSLGCNARSSACMRSVPRVPTAQSSQCGWLTAGSCAQAVFEALG
jgi:hypothetical protein